jgi:hypothetical protein
MVNDFPDESDLFISALRWVARLLGLVVVGTAVVFLVGTGGFNPLRLSPREMVLMTLFWVAILGLLVGWRREALGGALTVGSMFLFALLEWLRSGDLLRLWAFALIALPGLFFLCCAARGSGPEKQGRVCNVQPR